MLNLCKQLQANPYPGRGIVLGRSLDGTQSFLLYFIMGRSENSRNRIFVTTDDGIRTQAFDPSKVTDPSLILYHPVRQIGKGWIVSNGDQTDTIRDFITQDRHWEEALRTRSFEPDAPNWTPRISGLLSPDGSYKLSILKSANPEGSACLRQFFEYPGLPGSGHFLSTYETDGSPLPSFRGEPRELHFETVSLENLAHSLWDALHPENKVSLFAMSREIASGSVQTLIINRHVSPSQEVPAS